MTREGLRLSYFNSVHGDPAALRLLIKELGLFRALKVGLLLKWRTLTRNPFAPMNKLKKPSTNETLSERQMAPLILGADILREMGLSPLEIRTLLEKLSRTVATAFLKFNIPIIRRVDFSSTSHADKVAILTGLTGKFFNAEAELSVDTDDNFSFTVNRCHFARYAEELGLGELATLFCEADESFFVDYQPDVAFARTHTLTGDGLPCDFRFRWKEPNSRRPDKIKS